MAEVKEIYHYLDSVAPFALQMDFDNSGLLVGGREQGVERALLALDITPVVIEEAVKLGVQLIISHHPVIFHPLRRSISHLKKYIQSHSISHITTK